LRACIVDFGDTVVWEGGMAFYGLFEGSRVPEESEEDLVAEIVN